MIFQFQNGIDLRGYINGVVTAVNMVMKCIYNDEQNNYRIPTVNIDFFIERASIVIQIRLGEVLIQFHNRPSDSLSMHSPKV